jgi:hypothetical protein
MSERKNHTEKSVAYIKSLGDLADDTDIYTNLSSPIIVTNEDKLNIILSKHMKQTEKKRIWIAPLSILITLVVASATSTFKSALGLSPDTWRAIFIFVGVATLCWFIWSIKDAMRSKKIHDIIDELKKKQE